MKKILIILGLSLFPQLAEAQSQRNPCIYINTANTNCVAVGTSTNGVGNSPMPVGGLATAAAPTYVEGLPGGLSFDLSGRLRTISTVAPAGTQDINITQILGAAPSLTNPLWITPATGATFAATQSGTWTIQPGNTANTTPWLVTPSNPVGITPTDRTVTSATGSSQTVMSANSSRRQVVIVNTGSANCGINPTGGTAVIGGAGTLTLVPNGAYSPKIPTLTAITAICTGSQPLYAEES